MVRDKKKGMRLIVDFLLNLRSGRLLVSVMSDGLRVVVRSLQIWLVGLGRVLLCDVGGSIVNVVFEVIAASSLPSLDFLVVLLSRNSGQVGLGGLSS